MRLICLPTIWTVLLDILIWLVIHMGMAMGMARASAERFDPKSGWFRNRAWETSELYERTVRIRSWKKFLPDGAPLLGSYGFPKKRLGEKSADYFRAFARETCRAEFTHWLIAAWAPVFYLWNQPFVGMLMIVYALAENLPVIAAQRYNRARLLKLLDRLERTRESRNQ